jgi:phospholipid/cholesterol/gamma-HCH transport system permease protein
MSSMAENDLHAHLHRSEEGLAIEGRLDAASTAGLWEALSDLEAQDRVVDASRVSYCDGAGIALLFRLRERGARIQGLPREYGALLDRFKPGEFEVKRGLKREWRLFTEVGMLSEMVWRDIYTLIAFTGELTAALFDALIHPRKIRWKDAYTAAEKAGVNALPIVALVSFLMGFVLAFQSSIPMKKFGADIWVANLVALTIFREMGPLLTAIILAGRTGSAFAAELGTMKINEEVDALTTMGLEPVKFLAVTRVAATMIVTPLLTVFANVFGLAGGALVMLYMGFPLAAYVNQITLTAKSSDFMGGIAKAFVFGLLVAAIGCLRGLQTRTGASGVGESTTSAVVSGIVLIIIVDGVFAVVYFTLGI